MEQILKNLVAAERANESAMTIEWILSVYRGLLPKDVVISLHQVMNNKNQLSAKLKKEIKNKI